MSFHSELRLPTCPLQWNGFLQNEIDGEEMLSSVPFRGSRVTWNLGLTSIQLLLRGANDLGAGREQIPAKSQTDDSHREAATGE